MSLADRAAQMLAQPSAVEKQYKPRVEFDGVRGFIIEPPRRVDTPAPDHVDLLNKHGFDPTAVRIVENKSKHSRWQQHPDGPWLQSDRFEIEAIPTHSAKLEGLLDEIAEWKPREPVGVTGTNVFVFQASDLQLGKMDGDGVDGTIAAYLASVERAVALFSAWRDTHKLGIIHLVFAGDCIEGNVSQKGRNMWRTRLTITEQTRVFRRLLMTTIEWFAALADEIHVSVVNGNHDEAQRFQTTRPDDGWATEVAIQVDDALHMNPKAFDHIEITVPPLDQGYFTKRIGDTVFTIAHGHQWSRGKVMAWLAGQSLDHLPAAATNFVLHGHEHEFGIRSSKTRTAICSQTFDGGSNWYTEKTGAQSRRGGLAYITSGHLLVNLTEV